ncbi:MAG: molybdopterin-dependent oxidoreductase, partial [Elusimicrobia bacterium]|nr:molybdopterin-dependent oxidoreductase [Elusimicrobiota bacterium]
MTLIGENLPKVDSLAKATGRARYAGDLSFPRMLRGRLLRSPYPRARIVAIDVSKARALKGVAAVLTGSDLPVRYGMLPVTQDETALAIDEVRYVGEPVAAVAAIDEETAERAIALIDVSYEPLDPALAIEQALDRVGEIGIQRMVSLEFGADPSPAEHRREDLFFYEGNTHLALEEHSATALWRKGRLTLYASTQTPFHLRTILAKAVGLSEEHVRVVAPAIGGGFGGKLDPFSHDVCAAKLAMATGRPVQFTLSREEVFYCHRGRHPSLMRLETGWTRSGKLVDMRFQCALDGGAYGSFGVVCTYYHGALQPTTYDVPHYIFQAARLTTNKPPCGPKRGHGTPQPRFALEVHIDKVAEELGIDPIELRLKNLVGPDSVTVNQLRVTSSGLRRCVEVAAEASGFHRKHRKLPEGRGIGFALGAYLSGAAVPIYWGDKPHSQARMHLGSGGRVTLYCGATDIGQGSDTVLTTVAAEVLGIDPSDIRLVTADTDLTPLDLGSYSSRVTYMAGNAAREAAQKLKALVAEIVPGRPFRQAAALAVRRRGSLEALGSYTPPPKLGRYKGSGVGPSPAYSFSACSAEVECDTATGLVRVSKVTFAHDIGRAINRKAVEGQIEGAVHMGLGEALMEEQVFHPSGTHRKPSLLDYKFLSPLEMPEVEIHLIESMDPGGPFGAKEVGQGPLLPVIPA